MRSGLVQSSAIAAAFMLSLAAPAAFAQDAAPAAPAAEAAPARSVTVEPITAGTGDKPGAEDFVLVNYKGMLKDGTVFDQADQTPLYLPQMIPGFAQGIIQMQVGGKYRLTIPSELGYGATASGPIPANSDLIFEVEVLDYKTPEQYAQMVAQARAIAAQRVKAQAEAGAADAAPEPAPEAPPSGN